jgi:hypothetical protein
MNLVTKKYCLVTNTIVSIICIMLTNMPEAPSTNALKKFVPRRTPPLKNTGTDPCATLTTEIIGQRNNIRILINEVPK